MIPPIPEEAMEDAGIVLGRRGAGKSNALMCLFERELDAGHRAVMIDPKGDRWGFRMNPDGSPSRFSVPIFGGDYGDVAIDETMGDKLGKLVAGHDLSCLIDLSLLSLGAKQRFMMDFAPALLHHNRAALALFIEEVDQFANQDLKYQPPMLVHHIANFSTLGRQRGIVPWVASQRPAKVNATVRSQADTFIGMKVTSPLDRAAYSEWFKGHSKEAAARVETEVGRLAPGEALVWIGSTEFFDKVQFPLASTFDSGRTPKHGERIKAVTLTTIDMSAILATLEERDAAKPVSQKSSAAATDNNRLSDYATVDLIDELERRDPEWIKSHEEFDAAIADRDHFKLQAEELSRRVRAAGYALGYRTMDQLDDEDFVAGLKRVEAGGREVEDRPPPTNAAGGRYAPQIGNDGPRSTSQSGSSRPERMPREASPASAPDGLNASARKMVAMLERIAPAKVPWGTLAAMVGNKARGGNFNAARKAMRESGLIVEDGDAVRSSKPIENFMTQEAAIALWKDVLSNPAPRMIEVLELRPMTREQIGDQLGIVPRGGNFNSGVAQLIRNGVAVDRGGILHLADPLPGASW